MCSCTGGNQVPEVDDDDDDDDDVHACTFLSQSLRSLQLLNLRGFETEFGDAMMIFYQEGWRGFL